MRYTKTRNVIYIKILIVHTDDIAKSKSCWKYKEIRLS